MQTLRADLVETVVHHFVGREDAQRTGFLEVDVAETVDALAFVAAQFVAALPPDGRVALTRRFLDSFEITLVSEVVAAIERESKNGSSN